MQTIAANCNVFSSENFKEDLNQLLKTYAPESIFLLADEGSYHYCAKLIDGVRGIAASRTIVIAQGDDNKNINAAQKIWEFFSANNANRKSILINLGGGMPCDLGGFCASTFKRGMDYINIPTTLLSQVDASLGGKTGMNLGGLKNEIGVFSTPKAVIIEGEFLKTLDYENLLSGFAEIIKHALIHDGESLERLFAFDFKKPNFVELQKIVEESIVIKNHFVTNDPHEHNIRKALNFGHTFGHAFETIAMRHEKPIQHGYAVAYGMVCELIMSRNKLKLNASQVADISTKIISLYGKPNIGEADFDELTELMTHDKKNDNAGINFTLLPTVGAIEINQIGTKSEIEEVLLEFIKM